MQVYLLEDIVACRPLKLYDASPLTGRPDWVQVNGIRGNDRVKRRGQWFVTPEEARNAALKHLDSLRRDLERFQKMIRLTEEKIAKLGNQYDPSSEQDSREEQVDRSAP